MEELAFLPAESRELALRRFELLRPYLDGLLSLRSVAKDQGIPYRTAARWVAGYRREGLAALARKGRSDEGTRRLATDHMVQAIEGLALERPPLPISSVYRQASAIASTLGEGRPSYPVVRRIVRALPSGVQLPKTDISPEGRGGDYPAYSRELSPSRTSALLGLELGFLIAGFAQGNARRSPVD